MAKKPKHKRKKQMMPKRKFPALRRTCARCNKRRVSPKHHKFCNKCWIDKRDIKHKITDL